MSTESDLQDLKRMMTNMGNQLLVTDMKIDKLTAVHEEKFAGVHHRLHALEADAEDTGKHILNINERRAESGFWWKKQSVLAVGALIMLVLSSCASAGVTIAVTKILGGR